MARHSASLQVYPGDHPERLSTLRTAGRIKAPIYPMRIAGTGAFLPSAVLLSSEIDRRAGKPEGWAEQRSGVRQRHVVTNESTVDMATTAAQSALQTAGLSAGALDCIIATGTLPHQAIPTTAVLVQRRLGLEGSGTPAFDVNATCLGFLVALDAGGALIAAGRYETVLVVASDMPSRGTSWDTPDIKALFGDGAAAVVLRRSDDGESGVLSIAVETYSEGAQACEFQAGGTDLDPHLDLDRFLEGSWFRMDGQLAYRVTLKYMPAFLERLLSSAGVDLDDIDVVVPHQASAFGLAHLRRRLNVPAHKVIELLATHGNQVAASMPMGLRYAVERGLARPGALALLIGTAAGITLGGAVVRL
jgi:3-oxoacyl-[acyl-carrier-protein] synthase III